MTSHQRRRPFATHLLPEPEDAGTPAPCAHCGRDRPDRHYELALEALRTRIRVLETAWEIETGLAAKA